MKKWLALGFVLCLAVQSFALDMGVKAGLTSSSFAGSSSIGNTSSRSGIMLGGYVSQSFLLFDLQVEGLYIEKGNNVDMSGVNRLTEASYLEVPVLVKMKPVPLLDFSVYAGPYMAILLSGKDSGAISQDSSSFNSLDYGAVLGASYRFFAWSADARYEFGIQDVYKNATGLKNGTLSLSVGYGF